MLFRFLKPAASEGDLDSRIASLPRAQSDPSLDQIVLDAWHEGGNIDTKSAIYGPAHWTKSEAFHKEGFPYYKFLAGFIRSQSCTRVFEIGTHYGGSALAMLAGGATDILTIDVSDLNQELHHTPRITKLTGDGNGSTAIKQAIAHFGGSAIDLLYVDADHRFTPTLTNIALYAFLLRPRFAIVDDIVLNPEMRNLWNAIRTVQGARAINCVDVVPEIRAPVVGFGLLKLR